VLEFGHETGRPHLHLLLDVYVPQKRLSILAKRCGFGSITDIRAVKEGGGFGYVYKYLGKGCGSKAGELALKVIHGRRFGVSRNIPPVRKSGGISACIEYALNEVSTSFRDASVQNVAGVLGTAGGIWTKSKTLLKWEGETALGPQETGELLLWFKSRIISREDLLMAGGFAHVEHGPGYLASILNKRGLLDETPF